MRRPNSARAPDDDDDDDDGSALRKSLQASDRPSVEGLPRYHSRESWPHFWKGPLLQVFCFLHFFLGAPALLTNADAEELRGCAWGRRLYLGLYMYIRVVLGLT